MFFLIFSILILVSLWLQLKKYTKNHDMNISIFENSFRSIMRSDEIEQESSSLTMTIFNLLKHSLIESLVLFYENTLEGLINLFSVSLLNAPDTVKFDLNSTLVENQQYIDSLIDNLDPFVSSIPGGNLIAPVLKMIYSQSIQRKNKNRSIVLSFKQKIKCITNQQFEMFFTKKDIPSSFELFSTDCIDHLFNEFYNQHKNEPDILKKMENMIDQKISNMDNGIKTKKTDLYDHLMKKQSVYKFLLDSSNSLKKPTQKDMDEKSGMFGILLCTEKFIAKKSPNVQYIDEKIKTNSSQRIQNKKHKMKHFNIQIMMIFDMIEDVAQYVLSKKDKERTEQIIESIKIFEKTLIKTYKRGSIKMMNHYIDLFFNDLFNEDMIDQGESHSDFIIKSISLTEKNEWTLKMRNSLLLYSIKKFPFDLLENVREKIDIN